MQVYSHRKQMAIACRQGEGKWRRDHRKLPQGENTKRHEKTWEGVKTMLIILIVLIVLIESQLCAYVNVKTFQIVPFNYMADILHQLYLNKAF